MPSERAGSRRAYIDAARGLAVLLMIEAHTLDAWTRPLSRHTPAFARAIVLGGFAAPLFLWLAGLALALAAARAVARDQTRGTAVEAVCRRGLEIFILAFLFRLQAFIVSPGSYLVMLFRVDILNIMGPAIVAAGLLWALSGRRPVLIAIYAVAATAVAMVTPIIRATPLVDRLPLWVQWYARPSGDYTAFTMFPWAGFVFAGAASGVLLSTVRDARAEHRAHAASAAVGLGLVALGFYTATRPSIYPHSDFWTSSPTWFAIRLGILMVGFSLVYLAALAAGRWGITWRPLERLGRCSLFVYWIHIELVYGYASWALRGRLPLWGAVLSFAAFSLLMYGAVLLKERLELRRPFQLRPSCWRTPADVVAP